MVFTYKLFCKPYRNFSGAAGEKKRRKNREEEDFFCNRNICIIKPAHRIVQVLLKCNSFILAVIIR
jgi:hypothetical protein